MSSSLALAANADQAAMAEEIRALKNRLVQIEAWQAEKQRYKLVALEPGVFVYALQQEFSAGEPPHWICVRCYNSGTTSSSVVFLSTCLRTFRTISARTGIAPIADYANVARQRQS